MRVEVLLPQPQHFLQACLIGADRRVARGSGKLPRQQLAERAVERRRAVVAEAAVALLGDQARILEQAEVPRHAGLREAQDAGQLGDVEALAREHPQQPQPRLVAEQPVQRRGFFHIYKSTFDDSILQDGGSNTARRVYSSSSERGQSSLSRRESERSASSRPPVWQV